MSKFGNFIKGIGAYWNNMSGLSRHITRSALAATGGVASIFALEAAGKVAKNAEADEAYKASQNNQPDNHPVSIGNPETRPTRFQAFRKYCQQHRDANGNVPDKWLKKEVMDEAIEKLRNEDKDLKAETEKLNKIAETEHASNGLTYREALIIKAEAWTGAYGVIDNKHMAKILGETNPQLYKNFMKALDAMSELEAKYPDLRTCYQSGIQYYSGSSGTYVNVSAGDTLSEFS